MARSWVLAAAALVGASSATADEVGPAVARGSSATLLQESPDAARPPEGTFAERLRFWQSSLWRDHKELILSVAAVGIAQGLLIAGLLYEHRRRLRAEQKGREQLVAMAHLDRRAAMGEMATALAHELKQPLGAILHNAESAQMVLEAEPPPLEEMSAIVADILKANRRATEIIQRMRSLLQKHELERKPVDVNVLVEETVALVLPVAASRGASVELDLEEGLRPVLGDRVHLQGVLLNLLLNALDAVANMAPERRRSLVRTQLKDHQLEVLVQDTGCGIPPDSVSRVFEPFYTTKNQGMGIGLSIARSIVEAHGGRLSAENNPGTGATLRLRLPVQTGP